MGIEVCPCKAQTALDGDACSAAAGLRGRSIRLSTPRRDHHHLLIASILDRTCTSVGRDIVLKLAKGSPPTEDFRVDP